MPEGESSFEDLSPPQEITDKGAERVAKIATVVVEAADVAQAAMGNPAALLDLNASLIADSAAADASEMARVREALASTRSVPRDPLSELVNVGVSHIMNSEPEQKKAA